MDGIRGWIEAEGTGHWFFVAFPVVLIGLLIWFKGRKVRFLIPSLLISIVIINPLFFQKWNEMGLYAYWRILWIIPVIPVVASLVPSITERIHKGWIKSVVVAVGTGLIVLGGTFLYNSTEGSFVEAANAAKLPESVPAVADRLFELGGHPRVIAEPDISTYIRQYTGSIDTLYGRDIFGYIIKPTDLAKNINNALSNGNYQYVSQTMLDEGYDYLIYRGEARNSFERVDTVGDYHIYRAVGNPQVIKDRNELGQIVAITTVDENGAPIDGEHGYAITHREYDLTNNLTLEWMEDMNNHPFVHSAGYVGIKQEWEGNTLTSRTYLGEKLEPIQRTDGYSKVTWGKTENGTAQVSFYDITGNQLDSTGINLMNRSVSDSDDWSDWITPSENAPYSLYYIDSFILDNKHAGDAYTCQIEVEFAGVTGVEGVSTEFKTQGQVDDSWAITNPWWMVAYCNTPPKDGVYQFTKTVTIDEDMAMASKFEMGFRCDNWASGSFRFRKIKIEKGVEASEWSPGI